MGIRRSRRRARNRARNKARHRTQVAVRRRRREELKLEKPQLECSRADHAYLVLMARRRAGLQQQTGLLVRPPGRKRPSHPVVRPSHRRRFPTHLLLWPSHPRQGKLRQNKKQTKRLARWLPSAKLKSRWQLATRQPTSRCLDFSRLCAALVSPSTLVCSRGWGHPSRS